MGLYLSDELSAERGFSIYLEKKGPIIFGGESRVGRGSSGKEYLSALKWIMGSDLFSVIERDSLSWTIVSFDGNDAEVLIENASGGGYSTKRSFSRGLWTLYDFPS